MVASGHTAHLNDGTTQTVDFHPNDIPNKKVSSDYSLETFLLGISAFYLWDGVKGRIFMFVFYSLNPVPTLEQGRKQDNFIEEGIRTVMF